MLINYHVFIYSEATIPPVVTVLFCYPRFFHYELDFLLMQILELTCYISTAVAQLVCSARVIGSYSDRLCYSAHWGPGKSMGTQPGCQCKQSLTLFFFCMAITLLCYNFSSFWMIIFRNDCPKLGDIFCTNETFHFYHEKLFR